MFSVILLLLYLSHTRGQNTHQLNNQPSQSIPELNGENSIDFMNWLLTGCWSNTNTSCYENSSNKPYEYEGYDGWYNNVGQPELGAVDTPLLRRSPAAYKDGVYEPSGFNRPEPLELSEKLLQGPVASQSQTGRNAFIVFFGQQVVEEILDAQRPACPPEYFNVKIPENHRNSTKLKHTEMPVLRTRYDARTGYSPNNPRQQLNEITPYLDGGLIYGTTKAWSDVLRTHKNGSIDPNGLLATEPDGLFPARNNIRLPMANPPPPANHSIFIKRHYIEPVNRFFRLGNPRGNENPFLLTFGVLWFRWHNFIATNLRRLHPDWSSDKIFNEARKWVIATQQYIVTEEWLREWLGTRLPPYNGYDPSINPQIDQFFQGAAFRFGHTLVPAGVQTQDFTRNHCTPKKIIRTCQSFWRPEEAILETVNYNKSLLGLGMDRLIMGMARQLCEKEDHKIVEDLRGNVFGPLEFSRRDLMALNIQRGRDHGLPDYNTVRQLFNLSRITDASHFKVSQKIQTEFKELYRNNYDDIDLWVGGIMETNNGPGELFTKIIIDQFRRIRDGDRFWYKNTNNGLFTQDQISRIESLTFYHILLLVTNIKDEDIQKNVFRVPKEDDLVRQRCEGIFVKAPSDNPNNITYYHVTPNRTQVENIPCSPPGTYDYFSTSDLSFMLTFVGLSTMILGLVVTLKIMLILRQKRYLEKSRQLNSKFRESMSHMKHISHTYSANEWISANEPKRPVIIMLKAEEKKIQVINQLGQPIRALDFNHNFLTQIYFANDKTYVMIKVEHNYDLVIKFDSEYLRQIFVVALEQFATEIDMKKENINTSTKFILKNAITRKKRQEKLDQFFRLIFAQSFHITDGSKNAIAPIDSKIAREVIHTALTITEFAEALSMPPESEFVRKMFKLADKDNNDFISFGEFMGLSVILFNGSPEEKIKLIFDMYDINGTGLLTREDFIDMLRSLIETGNVNFEEAELNLAIQTMMNAAGIEQKENINFEDFQNLLGGYKEHLRFDVNLPGVQTNKQTFASRAQRVVESMYDDPREMQSRIEQNRSEIPEVNLDKNTSIIVKTKSVGRWWYPVKKYIANKQLQIFWIFLYTMVLIAIFVERGYYYQVEREHSGLRRIAGSGITLTRGAASAIMFTYSTLLVTMCQNTITALRETFLHLYIPFDSSLEMHKYVACWALIFTIIHVVGHAINFYHISTQTSDDLTCLFPNFFHATHEIPKFHYWCWQTMTGFTGIALTVLAAIMFLFSLPLIRRRLYNWFWFAHSTYPVFYILMILHGTGRLIQEPFTHLFLSGPVILFTLDKIITTRRKTIVIQILKADCLPSDVTYLEFKKPSNFQYKSGQWIRIACEEYNTMEYHPFTLSSAPNEPNLSVHIRAVGPWTWDIRNRVNPMLRSDVVLPKIRVDGPFGDGTQDWYKYDVGIMIGAGIGVTPFASILKDIVYKSNLQQSLGCKKVYFLWVTRTQRQFEWMVDILRGLETADKNTVVSAHIFITQFYDKFDLRTILLYICERYFQRVSNKSLFTGLTAITHFGRPDFLKFFRAIRQLNSTTSKVGIFSCGIRSMIQAVDEACNQLNQETNSETLFKHHYKSF